MNSEQPAMRERRVPGRRSSGVVASSDCGYSSRSSSESNKQSSERRDEEINEILNEMTDNPTPPVKIKAEKTDNPTVVESALVAVKTEPFEDKENCENEKKKILKKNDSPGSAKKRKVVRPSNQPKISSFFLTPAKKEPELDKSVTGDTTGLDESISEEKVPEETPPELVKRKVGRPKSRKSNTPVVTTPGDAGKVPEVAAETPPEVAAETPPEVKKRVGRPKKRKFALNASSNDTSASANVSIEPQEKKAKEDIETPKKVVDPVEPENIVFEPETVDKVIVEPELDTPEEVVVEPDTPELAEDPEEDDTQGEVDAQNDASVEIIEDIPEDGIIDEVIEDIWHVDLKYETAKQNWAPQFLVKWDGFPPADNTNEPYEHVCHADVLKDYVRRKFEMHEDRIKEATKKLASQSQDIHKKLSAKPKTYIEKKLLRFDFLKFQCNLLAYIYTYKNIGMTSNFMKSLCYNLWLSKFYEQEEARKLKDLEIVECISEKENFVITIENFVDYSPVPYFKYLKKVKNQHSVDVEGFGCKCEGICNKASECCPKLKGLEFIYDVDGRNSASSHQMIVECNQLCKCSLDCLNRRRESKFTFGLFKTQNRGWALKTREAIPAGSFVIEYTGELIDEAEALKRSIEYKKTGNNYMFDLDYNEDKDSVYSIDATNAGNLSRFINHSCSPNLQTWPATSCNENPKMHRLYYFSLRPIRSGEELTVDYSGGVHLGVDDKPPKDADPCHCGSANCKGYIF